jgi:antitoxin CptB
MWITGETDVPENYDLPVYRKLKDFHTHLRPINV